MNTENHIQFAEALRRIADAVEATGFTVAGGVSAPSVSISAAYGTPAETADAFAAALGLELTVTDDPERHISSHAANGEVNGVRVFACSAHSLERAA